MNQIVADADSLLRDPSATDSQMEPVKNLLDGLNETESEVISYCEFSTLTLGPESLLSMLETSIEEEILDQDPVLVEEPVTEEVLEEDLVPEVEPIKNEAVAEDSDSDVKWKKHWKKSKLLDVATSAGLDVTDDNTVNEIIDALETLD